MSETWDAVVVGGGPAGATAARDLAESGRSVLLLDRAGRIKPCGGAVPPRLLAEFEVPESLLVNRVDTARIIAPSGREVDIPVGDGFVGMVDRDVFDEWLRERAAGSGAERETGTFTALERDPDGVSVVRYRSGSSRRGPERTDRARMDVGAIPGAESVRRVFAYHEVVASPESAGPSFAPGRCDVFYDGRYSPDFYAWVFPHGPTTSIGTGSMRRGFPLRDAVARLRDKLGLQALRTVREEGAPIPLRPLRRWDNGRDVVLAGDAAGVVAPASGEGIYYAMTGGRLAARSIDEALTAGHGRPLARARRRFFLKHGSVFLVLSVMQRFWYRGDGRRERFVAICRDRDVQQLTFEGYMHKELVRARPLSHVRIFAKNVGHLTGLATIH
ncbi:MAG: geranylgeranyl diphosphate reductase [Gemmatimonadota bacterium]